MESSRIGADSVDVAWVLCEFDLVWYGVSYKTCCTSAFTMVVTQTWSEMELWGILSFSGSFGTNFDLFSGMPKLGFLGSMPGIHYSFIMPIY